MIARELSRLAEGSAGELPSGYANDIYQSLREQGIGIRRQDALRLIRDYAEFLDVPGRVARVEPERFAPARSASMQAIKRQAALDVTALMRREGLSLARAVRR